MRSTKNQIVLDTRNNPTNYHWAPPPEGKGKSLRGSESCALASDTYTCFYIAVRLITTTTFATVRATTTATTTKSSLFGA